MYFLKQNFYTMLRPLHQGASLGKNNTQCTTYLKAKNKTNNPKGQRQPTRQVNNFVQHNSNLTDRKSTFIIKPIL